MKNKWITGLAVLGTAVGMAADEVQFSELPRAVQNGITRHLDGGEVAEIERDSEDGRTLYEVEIRRDGRERELVFDTEGKVVPERKVFNLNAGAAQGAEAGELDDDDDADDKADEGIFSNRDGRILGIPVPGGEAGNPSTTSPERNVITRDADGGLDTDKNDGRILGVPKRGFETLSLSDVPEAVQQTITSELGTGRLAEIEVESEDGVQVYEVDIERDGLNRELHIAADGTKLRDSGAPLAVGAPGGAVTGRGTSQVVPEDNRDLNRIPAPVQQTVAQLVGLAEGIQIHLVQRDGQRAYQVEVESAVGQRQIEIAPDGRVLSDSGAEK